MSEPTLPGPDQIAGQPHPRETRVLYGQSVAQASFLAAYNSGRLHSGWLLTGPQGIGKATLAWKIAAFLLSRPVTGGGLFDSGPDHASTLDLPDEHPDLRLILSGAHPRLKVLRRPWNPKTESFSAQITVDEVREVKSFFHLSAADGGRRVVIVDAADELNRSAANAILKELEEPPANTTILLVAHQPSRLLPTIRSRCRELRLATLAGPDLDLALEQLGVETDAPESMAALAAGSVGGAVRLAASDGLALYAQIVHLASALPRLDRPAIRAFAESCAGKANDERYGLVLELVNLFLSRAARAGALGEPQVQGALGEARLLTRLSPDPRAARAWAELQQILDARLRHGRAVNLDPAALILDMLLKIEETAQGVAAA